METNLKVRDLINEIENSHKKYGDDFLDWDIYTEQLDKKDKEHKKTKQEWKWFSHKDIAELDWEYFKCEGFWTKIPKEKIFTINVNY